MQAVITYYLYFSWFRNAFVTFLQQLSLSFYIFNHQYYVDVNFFAYLRMILGYNIFIIIIGVYIMSKKHCYYLLINDLVILAVVAYSLFTFGVQGGYDPVFHMGRIHTLATNIASGHFPNPIGFEYLNGLGYGVGFFYSNFFLYPFALLNLLGLSRYNCYLLFICCTLIASMAAINYAVQQLFHCDLATIIAGPLYLSSYYYIGIVYLRAAAGEMLALAIMPLALLALFKVLHGEQHYWYLLAISFAMLLVAHVLSFLILVGTAMLLTLFNFRHWWLHKHILWSLCKSALLFAGLTMAFLLPFLEQYTAQKYISTTMNPGENIYSIVSDVLYLNQLFDLRQIWNLNGGLFFILTIVALILNLYYWKTNTNEIIAQATGVILICSLILVSPIVLRAVVKVFRPLVLLQVITRINVVLLPLCVIVIVFAFAQLIEHWQSFQGISEFGLLLVISLITILFPIKQNLAAMQLCRAQVPNEYNISRGEYEPQDFFNYNLQQKSKVTPSWLARQEGYTIRANNHHYALIQLNHPTTAKTIMLPRLYYRGYHVQAGNQQLPVTRKNGLAAVNLTTKHHFKTLKIFYQPTLLAIIGGWISMLSFVGLAINLLMKKFKISQVQKNDIP